MLKGNVLSGLSCGQITRIVWAKNPRDPREVAPLKASTIGSSMVSFVNEFVSLTVLARKLCLYLSVCSSTDFNKFLRGWYCLVPGGTLGLMYGGISTAD